MIQVKQATFLDHSVVWGLRLKVLQEWFDEVVEVTARGVAIMAHEVNEWLLDRDKAVFVAYSDSLPIGFALLSMGGLFTVGDRKTISVPHVWVDKEHRDGPAGSALCGRLATVILSHCPATVQVAVRTDSPDLVGLLEDHGFTSRWTVYERRIDDASQ